LIIAENTVTYFKIVDEIISYRPPLWSSGHKFWTRYSSSPRTRKQISAKNAYLTVRRRKDLLKVKQRPVKMGVRTTYRTLSPKRAPFQIGLG
jgi:hypothetical protein